MERMERVTLDNKYRWTSVIMNLNENENIVIALSRQYALYAEKVDGCLNLTLFEGHTEEDNVVLFVYDRTLNKYHFEQNQYREAIDILNIIFTNYAKCRESFGDIVSGLWGAIATIGLVAVVSIFSALI